jgi:hypothetical protein
MMNKNVRVLQNVVDRRDLALISSPTSDENGILNSALCGFLSFFPMNILDIQNARLWAYEFILSFGVLARLFGVAQCMLRR